MRVELNETKCLRELEEPVDWCECWDPLWSLLSLIFQTSALFSNGVKRQSALSICTPPSYLLSWCLTRCECCACLSALFSPSSPPLSLCEDVMLRSGLCGVGDSESEFASEL